MVAVRRGAVRHIPKGDGKSIGIGSADVITEESVYRYKALQSIKVDSLPQMLVHLEDGEMGSSLGCVR